MRKSEELTTEEKLPVDSVVTVQGRLAYLKSIVREDEDIPTCYHVIDSNSPRTNPLDPEKYDPNSDSYIERRLAYLSQFNTLPTYLTVGA